MVNNDGKLVGTMDCFTCDPSYGSREGRRHTIKLSHLEDDQLRHQDRENVQECNGGGM